MESTKQALSDRAAAEPQTVASRMRALLVAALMLIGLGLRLWRIDYIGYWHDEVISTFLARVPASEIFQSVTASDSHPPLYHILLHFWGMAFSYDLIPLRIFSVLTGLLCIPATYLLGRMVASPAVGLAAAALMATAPFQIFHSQQARMYPLLTLLVLLMLLTFLSAWQRGGWRWALFSLIATAGFYTHVYFAFSLFAVDLWALFESARERRIDRRRWTGLILAQLGAVALFSPFLLTMLQLTSGVIASFWIPRASILDWLFGLVALLTNGEIPPDNSTLPYLLMSFLPAAAALVAVALVGLRHRAEWPAWDLLLFAVLIPCLVATLISLAVRPILLSRSLIGLSGPLFVLIAWAIVTAWRSLLIRAVAAGLIIGIAIGLAGVYPARPRPHTLDPALAYIFAEREAGDALIVLDWQGFDLTALRHPDAADIYVGAPPEQIGYWQRRMRLMRWPALDQVGPAAAYAGRYRRIWVLHTFYTYPVNWEAVEPWLEQRGHLIERRDIGDAQVLLYEIGG